MRFEKCGNVNGQIIMLIHGMATTGHACFDRIIPLLNTYCIRDDIRFSEFHDIDGVVTDMIEHMSE